MTQTVPPQLSAALRELTRLIKAVQYYPPGHPALKGAASTSRAAFLPLLGERDNLSLTVRREGFLLGGSPVDKNNQVLKKLAAFLFARLVQNLLILPDLSQRDLLAFATALTTDPADIRRQGGIKELLQHSQVTTIWVNETDLKSILHRKQEIETALEESLPDEELLATDQDLVYAGTESLLPDLPQRTLRDILAQLREARDDEEVQQLLQELVPMAIAQRTPEGRSRLLEALALLCQLAADRRQPIPRRELAQQALLQICDSSSIGFLIDFLCDRQISEKRRQLLTSILAFLRHHSTPQLMDRLTRETDAGNRKLLAATVARQGPQIIPMLVEYLQDERWYVVRNVISILGDIRDSGAVRYLAPLLHHEDIRVCCEAIRALTRIGGDSAVQILLEALDDEDPEISRQALLSLGVIGDSSAIPKLGRLVRRSDFFLKHHARTRDAIRALGEIGSEQGVPILAGVLRRRRLFKRRLYDELRAAAAQALGDIAAPASEELLQRAAKDACPEVARQAGAALKQLQRES